MKYLALYLQILQIRKVLIVNNMIIMQLVMISANIAVIYLRIQYGGFYALPIFQMERCLELLIMLVILTHIMRIQVQVLLRASRYNIWITFVLTVLSKRLCAVK
nr:MAG TPA: hypothetical protein [Bacteriophage sp.]